MQPQPNYMDQKRQIGLDLAKRGFGWEDIHTQTGLCHETCWRFVREAELRSKALRALK